MRCLGWFPILLLQLGAGSGANGPVSGQYLEDRSNRVYGCPCEWSSEFMSNGREAVLAWNIQSGSYDGQDLAGLRLAAVLVGRFTLSDPSTLRRSTLYADARAGELQRRAGIAWLQSRFGDLLGIVLAVREVPIDFALRAQSAELRVGDFLQVRLRQADYQQDTQPWGSLLYEPFVKLALATLATSIRTEYAGSELAIGWKRGDTLPAISGYYGTFATR